MTSVFPNKKVLEQEYKDLSGLLSNIVDSVPMYLFVKDTGDEFRYVYSSPMMNQLYGQYMGDVVGRTDFELFSDPVVAQAFRGVCRTDDGDGETSFYNFPAPQTLSPI